MTGVTLDGFKLFAAIGQNRDLFAEAETAIDKAGSTILLSQLKSKSLTLDHVQRLRAAIGDDNFTLALDSRKRCTGPTLAAAVRAVTTGGHGARSYYP